MRRPRQKCKHEHRDGRHVAADRRREQPLHTARRAAELAKAPDAPRRAHERRSLHQVGGGEARPAGSHKLARVANGAHQPGQRSVRAATPRIFEVGDKRGGRVAGRRPAHERQVAEPR
eukprot:4610845-Prymnesium_polylepis.1